VNLQKITPAFLRQHPLPDHRKASDKQQRGRVLVIAGSVEIPGGALLASLGALRAGAGLLQVATCESAAPYFRMAMPEALVVGCAETSGGGIDSSALSRLVELASGCNSVVLGPGMVDRDAVEAVTLGLLRQAVGPCYVLDASAFVQMRAHTDDLVSHRGSIVVTPHSGEMAKFLGVSRKEVDREPLSTAQQSAALIGAVVALKGATTHIVTASGESWLCEHGCIGLGTSGSGDTLAGILAGLLARGASPSLAACWSTYIHAEAGQRLTKRHGAVGFLAREIPGEIPRIMEDLK
jgi:ADP-dependent NAD(P)H-hydrate dehydratase